MTNKRLILGVVTALIATVLSAPLAQAAFTVTLTQVGPNVVATGSGTINTTDLEPDSTANSFGHMIPGDGGMFVGEGAIKFYFPSDFVLDGPTSFGGGIDPIPANSASGVIVGLFKFGNELALPQDYVSGTPLTDSATYDNATLSGLTVSPGIYVWTWGSGANADSFTLKAGVPEPATLGLLALGLFGGAGARFARRKRSH